MYNVVIITQFFTVREKKNLNFKIFLSAFDGTLKTGQYLYVCMFLFYNNLEIRHFQDITLFKWEWDMQERKEGC